MSKTCTECKRIIGSKEQFYTSNPSGSGRVYCAPCAKHKAGIPNPLLTVTADPDIHRVAGRTVEKVTGHATSTVHKVAGHGGKAAGRFAPKVSASAHVAKKNPSGSQPGYGKVTYGKPKKNEYGEWVIKAYHDGKVDESKTIYESTKEDAMDTYKACVAHGISKNPCGSKKNAGLNSCDHGHMTSGQVRRLPISKDGGAIVVCRKHYDEEMAWRREKNRSLSKQARFPYPRWESLKTYSTNPSQGRGPLCPKCKGPLRLSYDYRAGECKRCGWVGNLPHAQQNPSVSMASVREEYRKKQPEGHWFDRDTMDFFKTILPGSAVKRGSHTYFVTSEQGPSMKRKYSVRVMDKDGNINTVGDFNIHHTQKEAEEAMWDAIEGRKRNPSGCTTATCPDRAKNIHTIKCPTFGHLIWPPTPYHRLGKDGRWKMAKGGKNPLPWQRDENRRLTRNSAPTAVTRNPVGKTWSLTCDAPACRKELTLWSDYTEEQVIGLAKAYKWDVRRKTGQPERLMAFCPRHKEGKYAREHIRIEKNPCGSKKNPSRGRYYRDGEDEGRYAARVGLGDPAERKELRQMLEEDRLGEAAGQIREHGVQMAGDISYDVGRGVTERQYESWEKGFYAGYEKEVRKALKGRQNPITHTVTSEELGRRSTHHHVDGERMARAVRTGRRYESKEVGQGVSVYPTFKNPEQMVTCRRCGRKHRRGSSDLLPYYCPDCTTEPGRQSYRSNPRKVAPTTTSDRYRLTPQTYNDEILSIGLVDRRQNKEVARHGLYDAEYLYVWPLTKGQQAWLGRIIRERDAHKNPRRVRRVKKNDIPQDELRMGVREEMEHTSDPKVARRIALDHLREDRHYYTKMKRCGLLGNPSERPRTCPVCGERAYLGGYKWCRSCALLTPKQRSQMIDSYHFLDVTGHYPGQPCDDPSCECHTFENPAKAPSGKALNRFAAFHGFEPGKILRRKVAKTPKELVDLGSLRQVRYGSPKINGSGTSVRKPRLYYHDFSKPYPRLATDPSGKNLYIVDYRGKVIDRGIVG